MYNATSANSQLTLEVEGMSNGATEASKPDPLIILFDP